jgi:hypothetical protein
MFIYFIQKKGFLGGDLSYLKNRLGASKKSGKNLFYREFLCPLFFEGFAKRESDRSAKTRELLGVVPYLNGGLFLKHQIENAHEKNIEIPDLAFEKIFAFFDQYQWHLDDRPTRDGNEINPDVLGYVFEKYINQKEMGAYYTKEDITGYIGQNTIIPAVFDIARRGCKVAFEGEHSIWNLLKEDPDRYFYAAVLHGTAKALPKEIAAGIKDVAKRGDWNKTAPEVYGLPTETWREVVARRQRYEEVRGKLTAGAVQSINDLITYNLDIQRFAEEVISNSEGSDLVWAFYKAVEKLSVLDPTCGSGAFLFAALNILEKLYDTCLVRMQAFVDDLDQSGEKHSPKKFEHFRLKLAEMNDKSKHPSPRYFILKSIILNNLYGVDIMEEATEICKLRLFLKLVAQVSVGDQIEPLPDIDFNIQPGNTLIGFVNEQHLQTIRGSRLDYDSTLGGIKERAEIARQAYDRFRYMQVQQDMPASDFRDAKAAVNAARAELRDELDDDLAGDYNIKRKDKSAIRKWRENCQPFHWFVEFFGIVQAGGFDVIIGNPPYVEYSKVKSLYSVRGYHTEPCSNLYAFAVERSFGLLSGNGRFGMIVPMSAVSTARMQDLRSLLLSESSTLHFSHYSGDAHPAILFNGVKMRLSIVLAQKREQAAKEQSVYTTGFMRWYSEARPELFPSVRYVQVTSREYVLGLLPKLGSTEDFCIFRKILARQQTLAHYVRDDGPHELYAHRIVAHFVKCFDFVPHFKNDRDGVKRSEDYKIFAFDKAQYAHSASAVLNSTLFYFYYLALSDAYHCGRELILNFPCDLGLLVQSSGGELLKLNRNLMKDVGDRSVRRKIKYHGTGWIEYDEFYPRLSKAKIDEIDVTLAAAYGLTSEEVDHLINYDIKFRLGSDAGGEDEADAVGAN